MYQTHIKQWGLDKKNKKNEMRAVIRKTASRVSKGKDSTFYIRGKTVSLEKVVRYWQRKGVSSIDKIIARREVSKTPEDVECLTPVLSPLKTLDEMARDEWMLVAVRDYLQYSSHTREGSFNRLPEQIMFNDMCMLACQFFKSQSHQEAGQALIKAMTGVKSIVQTQSPHAIAWFLSTIKYIISYGITQIATAMLRHFAAMSHHLFPEEHHPSRIVWSRLTLMDLSDPSHYNHVSYSSMRVTVDCLEKLLGPLHDLTIDARLSMLASYGDTHSHREQELGLKSLHRECELALGPDDDRTFYVGLELAWHYRRHDNPMEAKRLAQALCDQTKPDGWRAQGLDILASSQYDLGEMVAAEENMRKAIDLGITAWGCDTGEVHEMMLRLEDWLVKQGKLDSAAQLREERMGYWEPPEML